MGPFLLAAPMGEMMLLYNDHGFSDNPGKYIGEWLNGLTDKEITVFANKLLKGYKPCPRCGNLCRVIHHTPKVIYKINPQEMCIVCLLELVTNYNRGRKKENRLLAGHIDLDFFFGRADGRNKEGGVIYLCRHQNIYKMGASTNPYSRITSQGYRADQFICAIETLYPFDLEKYLQRRFRGNRTSSKELFELDEKDIEFIKGIKTVNGKRAYYYQSLDDLRMFPRGVGK